MVTNDGDCFKCGQPGHWAQHCPLNYPAASKNEHYRRLDDIKMRFLEFEITPQERTRLIIAENELWKDKTGARK